MADIILHDVLSIRAEAEPNAFIISVDMTAENGERYTCGHAYRSNDPYSVLNPLIRKWLVDHNGEYTVLPHIPAHPSTSDVDRERDRRVDGGFTFGGVLYQSDAEARENIAGAAQLAFAAIVRGAEPGDLHWHGEPEDFKWIAFDDTRVPMDAETMFSLGQAALAHKRRHIFAGNDLKKLDPIPADFTADQYWP